MLGRKLNASDHPDVEEIVKTIGLRTLKCGPLSLTAEYTADQVDKSCNDHELASSWLQYDIKSLLEYT